MVRANEAVIGIFEVWLQGDDGLLGNVPNLLYQMPSVFALVDKVLQDRGEKLLRRLIVICKGFRGSLELMGVLVQTKVGQVHVKIFDIRMVRLLVVVGAKSGKTLIAQIGLHWVDTPD